MGKPVLVIMAAGMGSRYGGLKQIDSIDSQGQIIMDYSIYDARLAGFEKVIFIIKRENEALFRSVVGDRLSRHIEVAYVFQDITNIPEGYCVPEGRVKPWGTGHAILSALDEVNGPFAVINADDYYGRDSFQVIYDYLSTHKDNEKYRYTMVGYRIDNTVTDNGHVARGVCETDADGNLVEINERTRIEKFEDKIAYTEDEGKSWIELPEDTVVSMNMWGFSHSILKELEKGLPQFLEEELKRNPLKCEYFLPTVVSNLLHAEQATVEVLKCDAKWYGVTYKEDKPMIEAAVQAMKDAGKYPDKLWD